jgi:hypothetical protein
MADRTMLAKLALPMVTILTNRSCRRSSRRMISLSDSPLAANKRTLPVIFKIGQFAMQPTPAVFQYGVVTAKECVEIVSQDSLKGPDL